MKKIILILSCFLVLQSQAQERKYLLFTENNINRLENRIKNDPVFSDNWKEKYKEAKNLLKKDKLRSGDCQLLGLVYRVTGEEKFAGKLKDILLDYVARDTWEGKTLLSRIPPWSAGLSTSHTSYDIALGYDCIYNYLTTSERQEIARGIVRLGIRPVKMDWLDPSSSYHTFDTMGHNWWSACVYMAGFASLSVRDEIPEATRWARDIEATAREWINFSGSVLQNKPPTFDRDGGFYESLGYASYALTEYLTFINAYANVWPDVPWYKSPVLDHVGDFFINTAYYTGDGNDLAVNFGDAGVNAGGGGILSLLWNLGYQNKRYAWYINHLNKNRFRDLRSPVSLALYPDLPSLDAGYLPDRPTSHLYQDMGWAVMRNSWEDDATMLAVKSGFTWNHAHADAGSYILFHKGKNLIIDAGSASYLSPLYAGYFCQSEAHNVVFFNGKAQDRHDPYFGVVNPGSLHNLVEGKDFKYVLANATGPYSQILARNYRNFIWVGDVILIIDDLLAHEPGQFEWLLHYNGESQLKGGIDLTIRDGDAGVRVRPLYPETFPPGGERPHDFPEHMRLKEVLGYEDHHPENRKPYWSVSHFEQTARTKFVTAIILEDDKGQRDLPVIKRFEGTDFLGVSITQDGTTTDVYLNLLADGRLKHRNSAIDMNGWETDAYLTVLKYAEGADKSKVENVKEVFLGHGSYLRRDGQTLVHALSKYTALIEDFGNEPEVTFEGQNNAVLRVYSKSSSNNLMLNHARVNGEYEASDHLIKLEIQE
jgi:oligo-alginate lyase